MTNIRKILVFVLLFTACFLAYHFDAILRLENLAEENQWHIVDDTNLLSNRNKKACNSVRATLKSTDTRKHKPQEELEKLNAALQNRLCEIQNPQNCSNARKLLCRVRSKCGLGCYLHYIAGCFMLAIGTNRTLVLDIELMRGINQGLLITYQPISQTCYGATDRDVMEGVPIQGDGVKELTANHRIVTLTITVPTEHSTLFAPFSIPIIKGIDLDRLHDRPHIWWAGQLLSYVSRLQPKFREYLDKVKKEIDFTHPIVGLHVRRTDKITESSYVSLDYYMSKVEEWFVNYTKLHSQELNVRRVFLASDDTSVYHEAVSRYPRYTFLTLPHGKKFFHQFSLYDEDELISIVQDLHLLSETDYLVCTFSSQLGRSAYLLMAANSSRSMDRAYSVDIDFKYDGQLSKPTYVEYPMLDLHAN